MTDQEFREFTKRLFVEYPSLYTRLERTIDMTATLKHWQKKLIRFELAELNAVLDYWDKANLIPWDSYAIEHAPSVIASVALKNRDAINRSNENETIRKAGRRKNGTVEGHSIGFSCIKGDMRKAFEELRPLHRKMKDGELHEADYIEAKHKVLGDLK